MHHRPGLTLVESLLAAVVLSVAVLGLTYTLAAGHRQMNHADRANRAALLAEATVERVLALPYDDPDGASTPGPEPGESAPDGFDNADDFHGYHEDAGELTDATGSPYPDAFDRFSRRITAAYTAMNLPGTDQPQPGLLVTAHVTGPKGVRQTVRRFIPEPSEQQPAPPNGDGDDEEDDEDEDEQDDEDEDEDRDDDDRGGPWWRDDEEDRDGHDDDRDDRGRRGHDDDDDQRDDRGRRGHDDDEDDGHGRWNGDDDDDRDRRGRGRGRRGR